MQVDWNDIRDKKPTEIGYYTVWEKFYSGSLKIPIVGFWNGADFDTCVADDWHCVTYWTDPIEPPNLDENG